jgi:asparagine synthase (glutamine-hydrolysing)
MCGICGVFYYEPDRPVDREILIRMTERMQHRGPDGHGVHLDRRVGLGHRRLAIIDHEGGSQPMSNEDETVWISFNGEIYNHAALRHELIGKGHEFRSRCDTEVLVHAYEEWSDDFVSRVNGMFALAIWDGRKSRLMLARDRLGIKPLYYFHSNEFFAFASELPALLQHPCVPVDIDSRSVQIYLNLQYVPAPATILAGIKKLESAELVTIEASGELSRRNYWECAGEETLAITEEDATDQFRELLTRSVRRRLMSDVPLGAFLSGGIDSSCIVAMMADLGVAPLKTFSIGFDDSSYNELHYARCVAQHYGTEHRELVLKSDPNHWIDWVTRDSNEPLADTSMIPTSLVCRLAREDVTVCLSGDGADELLCGYERHLASLLSRHLYEPMPRLLRQLVATLTSRLCRPTPKKKAWRDMVQRFVLGGAKPSIGRQMRWQSFLTPHAASRLFASDADTVLSERELFEPISRYGEALNYRSILDLELSIERQLYLPNDILAKVDRTSMAMGLEVRVPFLDHELVEFVSRLPVHLKMRRGRGKYILRRAMKDRLPGTILARSKQGFSMPVKRWLARDLSDHVDGAFQSPAADLGGLLSPAAMRELLAQHRSGDVDNSHIIWSLFILVNWLNCQSEERPRHVA